MKSIVNMALILIFSLAMIGKVSAQDKQFEAQLEQFKTKLVLTPAQYLVVKNAMIEARDAKKANELKFATDKKALFEANKIVRQTRDNKINAQLTAEQKKLFKEFKEENHATQTNPQNTVEEKIQNKTNELTTDLGLSSAQTAKAKAIYAQYLPQIQAIRVELKDNEDAAKAKIQPIKKEMNDKISSILTDEQKTKQKALKKEDKH